MARRAPERGHHLAHAQLILRPVAKFADPCLGRGNERPALAQLQAPHFLSCFRSFVCLFTCSCVFVFFLFGLCFVWFGFVWFGLV